MRVVVLGAGIAGMAAAAEVLARAPHADVRLLEAGARCGGLVHTERLRGLLLEHGPDSLASSKPAGMQLIRRLGLEPQLVTGTGAPRVAYVAQGARLVPLPPGLMAFRKGAALDIVRSPLLSLRGKLRVLAEPFCRRRDQGERDESLAAFVTRRFGAEMLERIIEPLVGSVYGTEPERMSASAALPNLVHLEQEYGSVGMALVRGPARPRADLPYLVSLAEGMGALPSALRQLLSGRVYLGQRARRIERRARGFRIHTQNGAALDADRVIMALPAHAAAGLTETLSLDLASELSAVEYTSVASLHFAYRSDRVPHPMQGTGFVVPLREKRAISACTWASRKWPARAPAGWRLFRCFLRESAGDDQSMIGAALNDLRDYLGVEGAPAFSHVLRIERALPRYTLEHGARRERIEQQLAALDGFAMCGSALHGMGVPECIASGSRAAEQVLASIIAC